MAVSPVSAPLPALLFVAPPRPPSALREQRRARQNRLSLQTVHGSAPTPPLPPGTHGPVASNAGTTARAGIGTNLSSTAANAQGAEAIALGVQRYETGALVQLRGFIVGARRNGSLAVLISFDPDTACYTCHPLPPPIAAAGAGDGAVASCRGFPEGTPARVLEGVARLASRDRFEARALDNLTPISAIRAAALQPATTVRAQLLREAGKVLEADGFPEAAETTRRVAVAIDDRRRAQTPTADEKAPKRSENNL
jgi:hypothetical protein